MNLPNKFANDSSQMSSPESPLIVTGHESSTHSVFAIILVLIHQVPSSQTDVLLFQYGGVDV